MSRSKLETPLIDAEFVNILPEDCLFGDICMYAVGRDTICPCSSLSILIYISCAEYNSSTVISLRYKYHRINMVLKRERHMFFWDCEGSYQVVKS